MNDNLRILKKKINILKEKCEEYKSINEIDELGLKECIYDVLSWIEVCIKDISKEDKEKRGKLSAIRYANNLKKHSTTVFRYNLNSYPLYSSSDLCPSNALYKNQHNNYIKYLEGKEVLKTIDEIYKIIK